MALIGWWKLDDGSGTTAADSSGNGNNGSLQTFPNYPTWTTGHDGSGGLAFAGNLFEYVDLGNPGLFQISTGTINAWIKTSGAGASYRGIITKQLAFGLFLNNDVLVTYDWQSSNERSTGINIADNAWHMVTLTFNSGVSAEIYLDGVSVLPTFITINSQAVDLVLAAGGIGLQWLTGTLDDCRIYDTQLSAGDIATLYGSTPAATTDSFFARGI